MHIKYLNSNNVDLISRDCRVHLKVNYKINKKSLKICIFLGYIVFYINC